MQVVPQVAVAHGGGPHIDLPHGHREPLRPCKLRHAFLEFGVMLRLEPREDVPHCGVSGRAKAGRDHPEGFDGTRPLQDAEGAEILNAQAQAEGAVHLFLRALRVRRRRPGLPAFLEALGALSMGMGVRN